MHFLFKAISRTWFFYITFENCSFIQFLKIGMSFEILVGVLVVPLTTNLLIFLYIFLSRICMLWLDMHWMKVFSLLVHIYRCNRIMVHPPYLYKFNWNMECPIYIISGNFWPINDFFHFKYHRQIKINCGRVTFRWASVSMFGSEYLVIESLIQ